MNQKPILIENFDAEAAVAPRRIVKLGTADHSILQAAAAADLLIGVTDILGADAAGDRIDVITAGVAQVELGGTVTRGTKLTANADGKAVAAATGNQVIGIARVSGVAGDIGSVQIAPSTLP
jgi:hypothetical protein